MRATTSTAPPGVPYSRDSSGVYPKETMSCEKKFDMPPADISKLQRISPSQRTVWDICNQCKEYECPSHRVRQSLLQLIHLEMLIPHPLLIRPNPLNGHQPFLRGKKLRIELVV